MADIYVKLPYDPTGVSSDNLVYGELHTLMPITGFPYKAIVLNNGGFYARSLRIYDSDYNLLDNEVDYIVTYRYQMVSESLGLQVCSLIVFLDPSRSGSVLTTAQMVGGDIAFSLTAVVDYVTWFNTQPSGYVPRNYDYNGNEPNWLPGELDRERWRLDTYQPFNNEIYYMSRATMGGYGNDEQNYRDKVLNEYNEFLDLFTDRLERHITDLNNPHETTKAKQYIDLGLVENYRVASNQEAVLGNSNNTYLTPNLSGLTLNEWALKPLNLHINDQDNHHQTTPAKISAPTKPVVNAEIQRKYFKNATVTNANLFTDDINDYTYNEFKTFVRTNIPADNIASSGASGYIAPARLGNGITNNNTVLRGNGTWVDWDNLITLYATTASPQLLVMDLGSNSPTNAHNIAISQPWAINAPVGSVILYQLVTNVTWGAGNGTIVDVYGIPYGSFKTPAGWIKL